MQFMDAQRTVQNAQHNSYNPQNAPNNAMYIDITTGYSFVQVFMQGGKLRHEYQRMHLCEYKFQKCLVLFHTLTPLPVNF